MSRSRRCGPAFALALLLFAVPGTADDRTVEGPPPDVERWIDELGSESFIQRDFAGRQLLRAGPQAIAPLIDVAGDDQDVAARMAIELLTRLARADQSEMGTAAHRGLAQLLRDDDALSSERREVLRRAVRTADRHVAAILNDHGGLIERDDSLAIVGVKVHGEQFTDRHARLLMRLPALRGLDLRDTLISDEIFETILALPRLEELNLSDTAVTGEGLQRLQGLKSLQKLSIYRLQISPENLEDLRELLPECEINR